MNKIYEKYFRDKTNCDILYIIGFVGILLLFIYKAPLEIQGQDEAFYLTVPKRLLDGDVFVFDEWHGSQFSALLVYPIMALHNLFFTSDGIVLHFRYIYIFFQALSAAVIYIRLRDYKLFGALASLVFFMFTPYDILALSYNTMGLMLVTLTGVILATAKSKKAYFVSGLLFAGAVLCSPYLLAAYAVFTVGVLIFSAVKKSKQCFVSWVFFTLGSALLAVILFAFILSRVSLSEFIDALPNIFDDPEHVSKPFLDGLLGYFKSIYNTFNWGIAYFPLYGIMLIALIFDKKRCERRVFYIASSCAISICMLFEFASLLQTKTYNFIMFPFVLVGLISYLVTKNKNKRVFLFMFVGSLLYTMCIYFSSNQGFYIISAMSAAADVGSVILIHDALIEEKYQGGKSRFSAGYIIVLALVVLQFSLMTYTKINHKFWSFSENSQLTAVIDDGPYKGIKVTNSTKSNYTSELSALSWLEGKEGRVLYAAKTVWYYLETDDLKVGAYSAWLSGESDVTLERLEKYYSINPDNIPDYIFVPKSNGWAQTGFDEFISKYGFKLVSSDSAGIYSRV